MQGDVAIWPCKTFRRLRARSAPHRKDYGVRGREGRRHERALEVDVPVGLKHLLTIPERHSDGAQSAIAGMFEVVNSNPPEVLRCRLDATVTNTAAHVTVFRAALTSQMRTMYLRRPLMRVRNIS
jgi:hypothetical protein